MNAKGKVKNVLVTDWSDARNTLEPLEPVERNGLRNEQWTATTPDSPLGESPPVMHQESHTRMKTEGPREKTEGSRGSYELISEIASGGMASVHLALQRVPNGFKRTVALKRIHPHLMRQRQFSTMFVDEARIAARITHPAVCRIFDFGHSDDGDFIAMEFLLGATLSRIMNELETRPDALEDARYPLVVARIVASLSEGLHAAHLLKNEHGEDLEVVHRDVTPHNLFVLYDGSVRVTDFGIAQARNRLHHTTGAVIRGKLSYMAPEQLERLALDRRADIWAMGVVLWELFTLKRLFRGPSEAETLMNVMTKPIPLPSTLNANVSPTLDAVVLKALARDRDRRYASARDLARDLERYLTTTRDTIPAMDLADWMLANFPEGASQGEALVSNVLGRFPSEYPTVQASVPIVSAPFPRNSSVRGFAELEHDSSASRPGVESAVPPSPKKSSNRIPVALLATTVAVLLGGAGYLGFLTRGAGVATRNEPTADSVAPVAKPTRPVPEPRSIAPAPREAAKPREQEAALVVPLAPTLAPAAASASAVAPAPALLPMAKPSAKAAAQKNDRRVEDDDPVIPPLTTGSALVSVSNGTAEVYESGRLLGRTPARITLSSGRHTLVLRRTDGSGEKAVVVDIKPGGMALVSASSF